MRAHALAGQRAERDRRVRRAEAGAADLGNGEPALARHQGQADDVGGLALVGRHAERRVALQVLDRAEAFAVGKADVGGGDVVLQVDEGLAFAMTILAWGPGDRKSTRLNS